MALGPKILFFIGSAAAAAALKIKSLAPFPRGQRHQAVRPLQVTKKMKIANFCQVPYFSAHFSHDTRSTFQMQQ